MKVISGLYEPVELEKQIRQWWEDNQIFQKIVKSRNGRPLFRFLEGPPTVNGFMHVGHARGRTMKDVVLRYKTMVGYDTWRQAGWDCQGLPVELETEKKLGVSSKKEIEDTIGLERFSEECNDLVDFYLEFWREASERLGLSLDYDNAYETRSREYVEFVWWALKEADKKRLLVEDFKVVPKCPRCETSLSGHEVAQGYSTTTDPSIYVKFPLEGQSKEYIIIWTTTPWTLPADEAVSVNPSSTYVRIKVGDEVWLMAEERAKAVMEELEIGTYEIVDNMRGKVLEGVKYVHPLEDEVPVHKEHRDQNDHTIVCGEHVTLDEGTGCVHTAPAHGPEDFEIGKKYSLKTFCPVNDQGRFTHEGGKYASIFVKDADQLIIDDLQTKGYLLKSRTVEHEYPFCWRCNTPLIYLADKQWFLRVGPLKEKILRENQKTEWVPEWAGMSRFEDWLVNAEDWCISRSRIWGSPLNVWECSSCSHKHVIGTIMELQKLAKNPTAKIKLHRPWIDKIVLNCPSCTGDMQRVKYVIDCWFDSGVAHAASLGLACKSLLRRLYPYDFITEAIDQTRGWFYSLVFTGVMLYNSSPYKRVLCQGHMVDKYGQKMSKSKGNVVWALEAMDEIGADPLRLYELWKSSPWDSLAFDYDEIKQTKRQLSILWNIFAFATTYMSLDEFEPGKYALNNIKHTLRIEDLWLLSRTQSLIRAVTENLDNLFTHKAIRSILTFITEDLSRFYVRLARRRTWTERGDPDKLAAYVTLYESLSTLLMLLAPFAPYVAEELYQALVRSVRLDAPESIHLCDWPQPRDALLDQGLETEMTVVEGLLASILHARQKAKLKLRWPVRKIWIAPEGEMESKAVKKLKDLLLDQANAKELRVLASGASPKGVKLEVRLNFDVAGPLFKEKTSNIARSLEIADGMKIKVEIALAGKYLLKLGDGSTVELSPDLLTFREALPNHIVAIDAAHGRIYLDVFRTPELLAESIAKEIIRRTQVMRKEMDLRVEEYIKLAVHVSEKGTLKALTSLRALISEEVRASELIITDDQGGSETIDRTYIKDWNIDGENVTIVVTRLAAK